MKINKLLYILSMNKNIYISGYVGNGVFTATITEAYTNKELLKTDIPLFGRVDTAPFKNWL